MFANIQNFFSARTALRVVSASLLLFGISVGNAAASIIVIDDFNTTQQLHFGPAGGAYAPTSSTTVAAGILGGSRVLTQVGQVFPSQSIDSIVFGGYLNFSTGSLSHGSMSVKYDQNGAGLGNLLANLQALAFDVVGFNIGTGGGPESIVVSFTDNTHTVPFVVNLPASISSPQTFVLNVGASGINFNNLVSLSLSFTANLGLGADITIANLRGRDSVVPEPSTAALALSALAFGGMYVRRRGK